MNIVIRTDPETREAWRARMSALLPDAKVYLWEVDQLPIEDIEFAIVWAPPKGMLASLPNLKAVFSVGAGVSHITDDPSLPPDLAIVRTTGPVLRQRMCEYVALHVLRIHRRLPEIEEARRAHEWKWIVEPTAESKTIGIMGLGNLGAAAAQTLKGLGYRVKGLSQSARPLPGVDVYPSSELARFLEGLDILVSMLPSTPATENIISQATINQLPKGAWIINVGRGSQVNDADLIAAIETDHISGAVLDVFRTEPLPKDHAFWDCAKILITHHTASAIEAAVGGELIAANIRRFIRGEFIEDMIDRAKGY